VKKEREKEKDNDKYNKKGKEIKIQEGRERENSDGKISEK
jgi:hypothetical protein